MGSAAIFEVVTKKSMMPRQLRGLVQVLKGFLLILLLNIAVVAGVCFIIPLLLKLYYYQIPALPFGLGKPTEILPSIIQVLMLQALGIGLSQLLYAIPIIIKFNRHSKLRLMTGVIIGVVFTFLANIRIYLWFHAMMSTYV